MKNRLLSAILLSQISLLANAQITIEDAWVRSAPPNSPALGMFMKIHNSGNKEVKLTSAYADGYARVELHRTIKSGEVMKMVKQDFMPISANGDLELKPGSWHIMLIKPDSVPKTGETVKIKLNFNDLSEQTINVKVKKDKIMMKMKHHNHHM